MFQTLWRKGLIDVSNKEQRTTTFSKRCAYIFPKSTVDNTAKFLKVQSRNVERWFAGDNEIPDGVYEEIEKEFVIHYKKYG